MWQSSAASFSSARFSASTEDPNLSVVLVPMPTIELIFGGKSHGAVRPAGAQPVVHAATYSSPSPKLHSARPVAKNREEPPEPANRIELIIDSLPQHMLTEPIPVVIDPLGETAFTASARNAPISVTGHSIGEALVLLKEQIESVYEDLNKRVQLSKEQKTILQMLHTYIQPQARKPEWMY